MPPEHASSLRRDPLRSAISIAVLVVLAFFVVEVIRPNAFPKRFGEVVPAQVYRSGKLTPGALAWVVETRNIKTIVDLGAWEAGSPSDLLEQRTADALGVDRVRYQLYGDATGNPNGYLETLRIMQDPDRLPVLVHCGAGTERTGAAVIWYRHFVEGMSIDDALGEARVLGHDSERNPKLREVLTRWTEPIGEALKSGGPVIGADPLLVGEKIDHAAGD